MNKDTIVTYTANGNSVTFYAAYGSPIWIISMDGASSNSIDISETQGVGQVGATMSSQSVQPKDITITGAVLSGLEANRQAILSCVLPGVTGRITVQQGGKSWYLEGAPKQTPIFSDGSVLQNFQFVFHAPYPYWQSTQQQSVQIAGLTKLFQFPKNLGGSWYISQYTGSLFTEVTNSGNVPVSFDLILTAVSQVQTPQVYQVETGDFIQINKTMDAGEVITVSTVYGQKGVTMTDPGGVEQNAFRYLDVGSNLDMQLLPGVNTMRYDAQNNREGLRVQLIAPSGVVVGL